MIRAHSLTSTWTPAAGDVETSEISPFRKICFAQYNDASSSKFGDQRSFSSRFSAEKQEGSSRSIQSVFSHNVVFDQNRNSVQRPIMISEALRMTEDCECPLLPERARSLSNSAAAISASGLISRTALKSAASSIRAKYAFTRSCDVKRPLSSPCAVSSIVISSREGNGAEPFVVSHVDGLSQELTFGWPHFHPLCRCS